MPSDRVERRLSAILAADVAGYSRLMGADEEGTLTLLNGHRHGLIDPKIAEHRGRIVKATGDGLLVEFASVVDALRCAVEIQRGMAERNAREPQDKRIDFRIGIHQGDIIIDREDIFGDGVNVAARLEGLAEPGGICVSSRVEEDAQGKLDIRLEDAGEQQLKNIERRIRVYRASLSGRRETSVQPSLTLPDKPSIAVLPFNVMQGDADDHAFADGLTEDIITALSRVSSMFVIARNSTFVYKEKPIEVKQVARDLGVRYVLEGSIRHSANRMRVTAQLIDAVAAHHVWAEKYDFESADIFAIQDAASQKISASVQAEIRINEGASLGSSSRSAADLIKLAWAEMYKLTSSSLHEARVHIERARALVGDDPKLNQIAAALEFHEFYLGHSTDSGQLARGLVFAENALSANPRDEYSHWIFGLLSAFLGQHDRGIGALRRSVELNPNFALGYGSLGTILAWAGEVEESREQTQIALRLNPRDPSNFFRHFCLGLAEFTAGQYREATNWARLVANQKSDWLLGHVLLIASLAMVDQFGDATIALATCRSRYPDVRIAQLAWLPFKRHSDFERLKEGLRKAGMPE